MNYSGTDVSCGVGQIQGLYNYKNTKDNLMDFLSSIADQDAHVIFSDVTGGPGTKLAKALTKYGTVTRTPARPNPGTGNNIVVFVFSPSRNTLNNLDSIVGSS